MTPAEIAKLAEAKGVKYAFVTEEEAWADKRRRQAADHAEMKRLEREGRMDEWKKKEMAWVKDCEFPPPSEWPRLAPLPDLSATNPALQASLDEMRECLRGAHGKS